MRIGQALLVLALAGAGYADTLTLRGGRVVNGKYLGGSARQIRMEVGDRIESFDVSDVLSIQFAAGQAAPASAPAAPAAAPAPRAGRPPRRLRPRRRPPNRPARAWSATIS